MWLPCPFRFSMVQGAWMPQPVCAPNFTSCAVTGWESRPILEVEEQTALALKYLHDPQFRLFGSHSRLMVSSSIYLVQIPAEKGVVIYQVPELK